MKYVEIKWMWYSCASSCLYRSVIYHYHLKGNFSSSFKLRSLKVSFYQCSFIQPSVNKHMMTKSKRDLFEFVETSKNDILWIFALRNHWIASRHVIFQVRKPSVSNMTDWYLSPEKTGNMWLANMTIVEPGPPVITLRTYFHIFSGK